LAEHDLFGKPDSTPDQVRGGLFSDLPKPVRDFSNQLPRPDLIPEQTFEAMLRSNLRV
jgi:hypothetical protein